MGVGGKSSSSKEESNASLLLKDELERSLLMAAINRVKNKLIIILNSFCSRLTNQGTSDSIFSGVTDKRYIFIGRYE